MKNEENSKQSNSFDKKELVQQILVSLATILNNSENWNGCEPKTPIAHAFLKNQNNAFHQFCFYSKYKPQNPSYIDAMAHEYFKWKTIYTAYNHPQKVLYDLNENKLTNRLQKALITHFIGVNHFKTKDQQTLLNQTQLLVEKKFSHSK